MSNYKTNFEKEFELLLSDSIIQKYKQPIKDLIEIFANEGHSGASAAFMSSIISQSIKKLLMFEPISELTGKDSEWTEVNTSPEGVTTFQNKRESAVFKENKDGKAYYLDAIIWKGPEDYDTFIGKVDGIESRQYFNFPFSPKKIFIDVVYDEEGEAHIKDISQLDEVFKVYIKN